MEISKSNHKAFLYLLFFITTPQGLQPKQFPIGKLLVAASAAKKLLDGAEEKDGKTYFKDGEITCTAEEWVFLKELLNGKSEGTISEAEVMEEVKELFSKE